MSYRGPKPPSQPRTLRSIAETKGTVPAGFVGDNTDPAAQPGAYVDPESTRHVVGSKRPIGPTPFASVRRGR